MVGDGPLLKIDEHWPLPIKATLRATTLDGEHRVFFLGPFATRVNFAAQQNRALNLVHAIEYAGGLDKTLPVAIIGAGLSGLTACTALHLLGYTVHLFEASPTILARQRSTKHRLIHPTVNAWPGEVNLNPTTELPFFDWCTDVCEDVLAEITEEWKVLCEGELVTANRVHLDTWVESYDPQPTGVILETQPAKRAGPFGGVIFATGFEDETTLGPAKGSYWQDDSYEHLRDSNANARFIVSGTGDGGLIDALRLCHQKFFKGKLALQAATLLHNSTIADDIRDAETKYAPGFTGAEVVLWEAYVRAAANLPPDLVGLLESSLVIPRPLVWLVGEDNLTPVARGAAPIHKLLTAYTRMKGALRYINGKVDVDASGAFTLNSKDPKEPGPAVTPQMVLVRHGANTRLKAMLARRANDLAAIQSRQRALHDDLVEPFWKTDPMPTGYPRYDPPSVDFLKTRLLRAQRIENLWPHLQVYPADREFRIESTDLGKWYPKSLFGISTNLCSSHADWKAL